MWRASEKTGAHDPRWSSTQPRCEGDVGRVEVKHSSRTILRCARTSELCRDVYEQVQIILFSG